MFAQSLCPLLLAPSALEQVGREQRLQQKPVVAWRAVILASGGFCPEKEGGQPHCFTRCRASGNPQPQVQVPCRSLFGLELGREGQGRG